MTQMKMLKAVAKGEITPSALANILYRKFMPTQKESVGGVSVERGTSSVLVSPPGAQRTVGVYLYGGCDTERLLDIGTRIAPTVDERIALSFEAGIASGRPDVILQQLDGIPDEDVAESIERLKIGPGYFDPHLFEPTFTNNQLLKGSPLPKNVIVLNIGASVVRTVYKHKEKGFLVDPGGWWLSSSFDGAKEDKETMSWFRSNFTSIGRLTPDEWEVSFRKLFALLTERTNAHLMVLGVLTVEPGDPTHTYVGRKSPETVRRRQFHLRLMRLADELGFSVVDVDRILKETRVDGYVDFAHMPREHFAPVIDEVIHLMAQNGIGTIDLTKLEAHPELIPSQKATAP